MWIITIIDGVQRWVVRWIMMMMRWMIWMLCGGVGRRIGMVGILMIVMGAGLIVHQFK